MARLLARILYRFLAKDLHDIAHYLAQIAVEQSRFKAAVEILASEVATIKGDLKTLMAVSQDALDIIKAVNDVTNRQAEQLQVLADNDQKIADRIEAILNHPAIPDEIVTELQSLQAAAQKNSDSVDSQVAFTSALASAGLATVTPVPLPPKPAPLPDTGTSPAQPAPEQPAPDAPTS